jgi:hypothetical protein
MMITKRQYEALDEACASGNGVISQRTPAGTIKALEYRGCTRNCQITEIGLAAMRSYRRRVAAVKVPEGET